MAFLVLKTTLFSYPVLLQNSWSKAEIGDYISQVGKPELSRQQGMTQAGLGYSREAARGVFQSFSVQIAGESIGCPVHLNF